LIGGIGPVCSIHGVVSVCWVGNKHADICHETGREGTLDVIGSGVEEGSQLSIIGCVEEEVTEARIRVHDFYLGEVVISVQGESMEYNI
jgi:hypothetical protein